MRSTARRILKLAITVLFLTVNNMDSSHSLAILQAPVRAVIQQNKSDGIIIDSYCESSGTSAIINLENFNMANRIVVEQGHIRMVRDNSADTKRVYTKNIEEE